MSDAEAEFSNKKRPATNGTSGAGSTDDASASPEPARKKAKRSSSVEDADARLAAQLQAQENRLARGRSTRGGGDKKVAKKKAPRKKSAKKVKPDDDSDLEGSEAAPKRKSGGGFQKPFNLSEPLQALCGETQVRSSVSCCEFGYPVLPWLWGVFHGVVSCTWSISLTCRRHSCHGRVWSRACGST